MSTVAPPSPNLILQQAILLRNSGRWKEAAVLYAQLLELYPNHPPLLTDLGTIKLYQGDTEEGVRLLGTSLEQDPRQPMALSNRAVGLRMLKRFDESLSSCDQAIALQPDNPDAYNNKGLALHELKRLDQALASFDHAIALNPAHSEAHGNRGNVMRDLKRYKAALVSYEKAYTLMPKAEYLQGALLHMKMHICDWNGLEAQCRQLEYNIENGEKASEPFIVLGLSGSPAIQKNAAEIYVRHKCPANSALPIIRPHPRNGKIRIGYFSGDYYAHPTAYLMAELFEKHDKTQFELIAFSFGPNKRDEMNERIRAAFDKFFDVAAKSDVEIAQLSRKLAVDIAVDLKGFTQDGRPGIFAARAAPIQVNYLGYPGTMGAEYVDYLIADSTLIPADSRQHYSEKIAYLPDSYQVNDTKRKVSDRQFSRAEAGLPPTGFVFCCFNNNYKITPEIFASWMRILKHVEGSVLWLLADNSEAVVGLRMEAVRAGVSKERLVFAERMPLPEHLARHRLADLFLDTLPYNAHTTSSDALWVGLPVLTCAGEAFASRVAASLLNAVHLPELITQTLKEYEQTAIRLASAPEQLASIREKLAKNRLTTPLFNIDRFTEQIESAYIKMYERLQGNLPPDYIFVQP